jgi:phage shock protein C
MERKLVRIEGGNSVIGGVAAGLAEYLNIDIAIVRVVFVLGFFTPLLLGYIILWAVLPTQYGNKNINLKDSTDNLNPFSTMTNDKTKGNQIGGIILVGLGTIFMFDEFLPRFDIGKFWPLILIGIGIYILTKDQNKNNTNNGNYTSTNTDTTENNL